MSYKKHLFICTNGNPDDPKKCASKGALELHAQVKEMACQDFNPKEVRINRSGCLGYCEKGITAVLYPDSRWFYELTPKSESLLLKTLRESLSQQES
jgi:(2Fe-2S) ferredoxin